MRSELNVLLDKIEDRTLRAEIRSQIERVRGKRTFGLVFESHLPERVLLHEHPIRVGVRVVYREDPNSPTFEVRAVKGKHVIIRKVRNPNGSRLTRSEAADAAEETRSSISPSYRNTPAN